MARVIYVLWLLGWIVSILREILAIFKALFSSYLYDILFICPVHRVSHQIYSGLHSQFFVLFQSSKQETSFSSSLKAKKKPNQFPHSGEVSCRQQYMLKKQKLELAIRCNEKSETCYQNELIFSIVWLLGALSVHTSLRLPEGFSLPAI